MEKATKKEKLPPRKISFDGMKFPLKEYIAGEIGISQSILHAFMKCPRTLMYGLNRWEIPGKEHNFFFGSVVHEILDIVYSNCTEVPSVDFIEEQFDCYIDELKETGQLYWLKDSGVEEYKVLVLATLECYFEFYASDFDLEFVELEREFDVKWNGFRLIGKKDGIFKKDGKTYLFEHKTKGNINEGALDLVLELDLQTFYYILADEIERGERADGTCYNVIRRFKGKQGANESLSDFYTRLKQVIRQDPDHFFKRWEVTYETAQHEEFRFELLEKLKYFDAVIRGNVPLLKNESNCFSSFECDYLKACATKCMTGYKQRESISPELNIQ